MLFPDPAAQEITMTNLKLNAGEATSVSVFSAIGERMNFIGSPVPRAGNATGFTLATGALPQGMYFLEVTSGDQLYRGHFIKRD